MVMLILAVGCHKREAETPPAIPSGGALSPEVEYARLRTELSLADSGQPYLVLNVPDTLLEVRLKGTPVWTTRLDLIESDRGDLDRFTRKFTGGSKTWVRPVAGLHLFAAQEKTPDSVLAIVSEALNVKKELLQRDVPERFRIYWSERGEPDDGCGKRDRREAAVNIGKPGDRGPDGAAQAVWSGEDYSPARARRCPDAASSHRAGSGDAATALLMGADNSVILQ